MPKQITNCPLCHQPFPTAAVPIETLIQLCPGNMASILRFLHEHSGEYVAVSRIAEYVYSGVTDGGPVNANNSIRSTMSQNRSKIQGLGWDINYQGGYGGGIALRQVAQ